MPNEAKLWQRVEHALREAQGDSLAGPGSTTRRGRCFERLTAALDEFHQLQEQYSGECTWKPERGIRVPGCPDWQDKGGWQHCPYCGKCIRGGGR